SFLFGYKIAGFLNKALAVWYIFLKCTILRLAEWYKNPQNCTFCSIKQFVFSCLCKRCLSVKKLYFCNLFNVLQMLFYFKNTFFGIVCTFLLPVYVAFGQMAGTSYEKLWDVIDSDSTPNEQKLHYLDQYLEKARQENNLIEEYQALKKKTYIVPFNEAVMILHKMHPVVQKLANDSITGNFYNRSTTLYYKNRYFKQALDYAIVSEAFNEKINNLYNLNSARIDIGNIYYHTKYYDKAVAYFTQAKDYYQNGKGYNHIQWYISCLYSLGKTYLEQEETVAFLNVIKESEKAIPRLKPRDRQFENAYLNYLKGGLAFLQKELPAARQFLETALPEIKQNGDFTNEP